MFTFTLFYEFSQKTAVCSRVSLDEFDIQLKFKPNQFPPLLALLWYYKIMYGLCVWGQLINYAWVGPYRRVRPLMTLNDL